MTNIPSAALRQHAGHIWEHTTVIQPGQPYARQNQETQPLAIIFSQDDLHPELGAAYLQSCRKKEDAFKLAANRNTRVDHIYTEVKSSLLKGAVPEAMKIAQSTPFRCLELCFSELDVIHYFLYLEGVGAEGGGVSDSDFFEFPGHFAVTWSPDWSAILDLFPEY